MYSFRWYIVRSFTRRVFRGLMNAIIILYIIPTNIISFNTSSGGTRKNYNSPCGLIKHNIVVVSNQNGLTYLTLVRI